MEVESKSSNDRINDFFFDAPNHFFDDSWDDFSFFDCQEEEEQKEEQSIPLSDISQLEITETTTSSNEQIDEIDETPQTGLRERSSDQSGLINDSSNSNTNSQRERRNRVLSALKVREGSSNQSETTAHNQESSSANVDSQLEEYDNYSSSFLVLLAGLIIKAIGFQVHLLIGFFSFPIWFMYCFFMFMVDPYRTLKRAKDGIFERFYKVWSVFGDTCGNFLFEKLKLQKSVANIALRFGWGFLCSVYICFVLFGLLFSGFVIGGLTMRYLVEEPIHMVKPLNFDYTKATPVALVPITSCPSSFSDGKYQDGPAKGMVHHVIPPNHKLELAVSLMMPESEYNQKLGVFQVRVDFLAQDGEVTVSSRYPCMLRFKSHFIQYVETFLKSVPLLAGYTSETQVLDVRMKGLTEGYKPTSCIRVILEQRAEYSSGAGIPELYSASLLLESELPLFKRILWYWRKTIFIWTSMILFTMEVLAILLCCRPVLIPRARARDNLTTSNTPQITGNAPQSTVAPVENS